MIYKIVLMELWSTTHLMATSISKKNNKVVGIHLLEMSISEKRLSYVLETYYKFRIQTIL